MLALIATSSPGLERLVELGDGDQRFAVGAHELPQLVAQPGQRPALLADRQQAIRAQGTAGNDDPARRVDAALRSPPRPGALGRDSIAVGSIGGPQRLHPDDLALGQDAGAQLLGKPQVVLQQRVLGPHPAADHARAAAGAAGPRRSRAVEVRVGHGDPRGAEVHGAGRPGERRLDVEMPRQIAQQPLGRAVERHLGDAQHPPGGRVVGREPREPVVQSRPLRMTEEGCRGLVQRVGVDGASAADSAAAEDEDVLEGGQSQDAAQAERRHPQEASQVPGRAGIFVVGIPASGLQHPHAIALLAQAQRGNTAPEAGPDDQPVEIVCDGRWHAAPARRS